MNSLSRLKCGLLSDSYSSLEDFTNAAKEVFTRERATQAAQAVPQPQPKPEKDPVLEEYERNPNIRVVVSCVHDGKVEILRTLDELGYDVAWQVLNSKNFGVPQSRNRVYIVGYLRGVCAGEVLAFTETSPASLSEIGKHPQTSRVYDGNGLSCTLTSNCGGFGGRTGMYAVPINCKTAQGYKTAYISDSSPPKNEAQGPQTFSPDGIVKGCFVDMNANPAFTDIARCVTTRQDAGIGPHPRERSCVFQEIREGEINSRFVLIVTDADGEVHYGVIRKLTPRECWRLQGFTEEQFNIVAVVDHILHPVDLALVDPLQTVQIVHAQGSNSVRRVAVQIDQGLETGSFSAFSP